MVRRKMKLTRQRDAMQCGAASLEMICRYHGVQTSLHAIESLCHATIDGVSMKGLVNAAGHLGLNAKGALLTLEQLSLCPLPAILHWNQNHFVVLYHMDKKGRYFHIADPAKGKVRYTKEEFAGHWVNNPSIDGAKGIVLLFECNNNPNKGKGKKKRQKNAISCLYKYVSSYKPYFVIIFFSLLLGCVLQLILPFLTQSIVDVGIIKKDIGYIWMILLGEMFIVAGRTVTDFIRRWFLLHISMRINISMVSDFFIKLLKLPMAFFDTKMMGDLLQRIGDHNRVQTFLTTRVLNVTFALLSLLVFGVVLLAYNRQIFFVFILGSLLYALWIAAFLNKRKVIDYEMFEQQAINQNRTYQFVTAIQEIKLQNCESRRRWEWEDTQADLFTIQMKALKLQQTQEAGSIFINEVKNIMITVLSATAVIDGNLSLGAMLAIQYIVGQLNSPVEQFMSFIYAIQDVIISLDRINEIHNGKDEEGDRERATSFSGEKNISINNLTFKYDQHATKKTLDHVTITIPAGKVTAIVGASGSGKSTLIKLILGYYAINGGSISIAGRDIDTYSLKWWRCQCGVVMQDGVIFSESIARNIAVEDGEIDSAKLHHAARIANIYDYIQSLPLGYDTKIGRDGMGLSQGQKQRILIARAVYKDPSFIFLDEATNALDAKNERSIVEKLNDFYIGKTVVIVAHRLSTVKQADQIIVIEDGKVAETGNHAILIEKKGAYYQLIQNQLELGE